MARKKFYLTLDTETATLPYANELCKNAQQKQTIAIAKPLVYDIGWVITDRQGNVYKKTNYLVQETFFVPSVFNTAYYKEKRPIYIELLQKVEIKTANWEIIIQELLKDLQDVDLTTAYNACFDFKKAIPYTEQYINALYSPWFNTWEENQKARCRELLDSGNSPENPDYLKPVFELREQQFPIADLWGIACERLININKYRNYCLENALLTKSALYFKTSAETSFQYLMHKHDFVENHTALSDAIIESEILTKALKRGKIEPTIIPFPFRELGTTTKYVREKKKKYAPIVRDTLLEYMQSKDFSERYFARLEAQLQLMETLC